MCAHRESSSAQTKRTGFASRQTRTGAVPRPRSCTRLQPPRTRTLIIAHGTASPPFQKLPLKQATPAGTAINSLKPRLTQTGAPKPTPCARTPSTPAARHCHFPSSERASAAPKSAAKKWRRVKIAPTHLHWQPPERGARRGPLPRCARCLPGPRSRSRRRSRAGGTPAQSTHGTSTVLNNTSLDTSTATRLDDKAQHCLMVLVPCRAELRVGGALAPRHAVRPHISTSPQHST